MIDGLECHAGRHRAVADDRDDATRVAAYRRAYRHAECCADRGARVADPKGVVLALGARRERRQPVVLFDRAQQIAAAGQHLMRVGLMADIPNQPVMRGIEHVMQCDRQLDGAEPGGEVATHLAHGMDQIAAQFLRYGQQFAARQLA
jgi:hypothetical protein